MKRLARTVVLAVLAAGALAQTGCKGCSKEPTPVAAKPAPANVETPAVALPEAVSAAVLPPGTVSPTQAPLYPGPRSESIDHFRITTGFASEKGEPLPQPNALDVNKIYVTVLDPEGRPVGQFDKLERGDMHGFLVARDLRQAFYAAATGPVKEGADARALTFSPREGGDHAFIAVFQPHGGKPHVVSAPLSIHGALPEVMGPGVESLSTRAKAGQDHVQITTSPAQPVTGQPVRFSAQDFDAKGQARGEVKLPFLVAINDQMGWGDVIEWDAHGQATWMPTIPGVYILLAPPTRGDKALVFKVTVLAPPALVK